MAERRRKKGRLPGGRGGGGDGRLAAVSAVIG